MNIPISFPPLNTTPMASENAPSTEIVVNHSSAQHESHVQLDLVSPSLLKIDQAFKRYSSHHEDITLLPSAFAALQELENAYEDVYRRDQLEGEKMQLSVKQKRQSVQIMNQKSPNLTLQDMKAIGNFFVKPLEKYYIDPQTGKRYIQPDHSQLLTLSTQFMMKGEYRGEGLAREVNINGKICDILYLKKMKDQILYEYKSDYSATEYSWFWFKTSAEEIEKIKARIIKQQKLAKTLYPTIDSQFKKWKYKSFEFMAYDQLNKLFDVKTAQENHALLFYYQEAK